MNQARDIIARNEIYGERGRGNFILHQKDKSPGERGKKYIYKYTVGRYQVSDQRTRALHLINEDETDEAPPSLEDKCTVLERMALSTLSQKYSESR